MATHSSTFAWRISKTEEPGRAAVHGVAKTWTQLKRLSTPHRQRLDLLTWTTSRLSESHVLQNVWSSMGFRNSVQLLSCVQLFETPWIAVHQASLSITNSWSLLKLMPITSVMPSNYLILGHPLLLPPSIFPSIRVFSNELVLRMRWPKYWSFSFSIIPSKEHPGLISFRMDWLDLLAVQGILKHLLQHHSSKASILQCPAFFIVQFPTQELN